MTSKRTLAVVSSFDSQFKWGAEMAKRFEAEGFVVQFYSPIVRKNQITQTQLDSFGFAYDVQHVPKDELFGANILHDFDVVLFSLSAGLVEECTLRLCEALRAGRETKRKRPVLMAGFVGVNYENRIGAVVARRLVDILLANSSDEKAYFDEVARRLRLDKMTIINGGLGLITRHQRTIRKSNTGRKKILVATQPTVPTSKAERVYFLCRLRELAVQHPEYDIIIKPRGRPGEQTFHKESSHFEGLLRTFFVQSDLPPNLKVSYESIVTHLRDADLCLTVSSTAALEAHAHGVPFGILTDFGIKEPYGSGFFADSGAQVTFDDLIDGHWPSPDPEWIVRNISYADDHFDEVMRSLRAELEKRDASEQMLPPPEYPFDRARLRTISFINEWRSATGKVRFVKTQVSGPAYAQREPRLRPSRTAFETYILDRRSIRRARKLLRNPVGFVQDSWLAKALRSRF